MGDRMKLVEATAPLTDLLDGVSIEVMPRTLGKVADMTALMAQGTRVYIAHIEGTPFEDMLGAAKRLAAEGFEVMPHFPARIIADAAMLEDLALYERAHHHGQNLGHHFPHHRLCRGRF